MVNVRVKYIIAVAQRVEMFVSPSFEIHHYSILLLATFDLSQVKHPNILDNTAGGFFIFFLKRKNDTLDRKWKWEKHPLSVVNKSCAIKRLKWF